VRAGGFDGGTGPKSREGDIGEVARGRGGGAGQVGQVRWVHWGHLRLDLLGACCLRNHS
jgi:hypothetical protein